MSKTDWSNDSQPNDSIWLRNSGIDTSIPLYDDPTLTYDEATEFYDGYDATTITEDDVKFDLWNVTEGIDFLTDEAGEPITDEMGNPIEVYTSVLWNALWSPQTTTPDIATNGSPIGLLLLITEATTAEPVQVPTTNWEQDASPVGNTWIEVE